jgi:anaerobic nitric oxide reductase flavorubredoxin
MFKNQLVANDIYYVGVNDRNKFKFENSIPLPKGVSYNAYLIMDEKTALVDTVDVAFGDVFIGKIQSQLKGRKLDYLIINHMEPDHSGSIRLIRQYFPEIVIVGNNKTLSMVEGFYGISGNTLEIKDGEKLHLGVHVLQFYLTPMVHWPETMMTFDETEKVLFSGDAFGGFGTLDGAVLDVNMNMNRYWNELARYYANIVGKYGNPVQKALAKLKNLEINVICSTHGPIWTEYVPAVVDYYDRLSRFEGKEGVVIVYGSMYGNTELMAETVAQGLSEAGITKVIVHNVATSDASFILRDIFKYRGLIIGSPTYCNELVPDVESLLHKIELRGFRNRVYGHFGSYTWADNSLKRLVSFGEKMKWKTLDITVTEKQGVKADAYNACLELGRQMAELVRIPIVEEPHCV